MMFGDVSRTLDVCEQRVHELGADGVLSLMRGLCLDDFAEVLLNMPMAQYPNVSAVLPRMASDEIQRSWTGDSGYALLRQSLTFVRAVWHSYERRTGKSLSDASILDYGCGYGRLLRLMMYFADSDRIFACDPWDKSIELCKESGINCDLKVTEYLPASLPYAEGQFDFTYAFSVFTHTSLRATIAALHALNKVAKPDGMLAITIRPVEYWDIHQGLSDAERNTLRDEHQRVGFAFRPHNRELVDGDITYGDTSVALEFIEQRFRDWRILGSERTIDDPYQRIVYLKPDKEYSSQTATLPGFK
jgi:SAM-dependent methyltransferase